MRLFFFDQEVRVAEGPSFTTRALDAACSSWSILIHQQPTGITNRIQLVLLVTRDGMALSRPLNFS